MHLPRMQGQGADRQAFSSRNEPGQEPADGEAPGKTFQTKRSKPEVARKPYQLLMVGSYSVV